MQLDRDDALMAPQNSTSPVTTGGALGKSPLGRLPPEIRNIIYEMVFAQPHGIVFDTSGWVRLNDGTSVSQAHSIRATCKQIRDETERMFFALNDINVCWATQYYPPRHPSPSLRIQQSANLLNTIPATLVCSSSKVTIWLNSIVDRAEWMHFSHAAKSIRHFQVFFGIFLGAHPWGHGARDVGSEKLAPIGQQPHRESDLKVKPLCPRIQNSMIDCARFEFIFPIRNHTKALQMVEYIYQSKVSMVEAHWNHRFCPIRCELENLLQSFIEVRRRLIDLVQQAFV